MTTAQLWRPNGFNPDALLPHPGPLAPHGMHDASVFAPELALATPGAIVFPELVSLPLFRGADTIRSSLGVLTPGLDVYLSYIDGFGGYPQLLAELGSLNPHAIAVSITIFGGPARCGDFEPGAMSIGGGRFARWIDGPADHSHGEVIGYCSASNMAALIADAAGRPFIRWSAHFGFGPHICAPHVCGFPQADMTQWVPHGPQGQNEDLTLGFASTLARLAGHVTKPPPRKDPIVSVSLTTDQQGQVHVVQELANGKVFHRRQIGNDGNWSPNSVLLLDNGRVPAAAHALAATDSQPAELVQPASVEAPSEGPADPPTE